MLQSNDPNAQVKAVILLTLHRNEQLTKQFGPVSGDFLRFLQPAFPDLQEITPYPCYDGHVPCLENLKEYDLIIILGSPNMVTEEAEWMRKLEQLIMDTRRQQQWLLGVCFGHQIVSKAFGGTVEYCDKGKELGVSTVDVYPGIVPCKKPQLKVLQSHKMHVTKAPDGLTVWCGNEHTPVQGLVCRDKRILTVQFHPEFSKDYFNGTKELDRLRTRLWLKWRRPCWTTKTRPLC